MAEVGREGQGALFAFGHMGAPTASLCGPRQEVMQQHTEHALSFGLQVLMQDAGCWDAGCRMLGKDAWSPGVLSLTPGRVYFPPKSSPFQESLENTMQFGVTGCFLPFSCQKHGYGSPGAPVCSADSGLFIRPHTSSCCGQTCLRNFQVPLQTRCQPRRESLFLFC